PPEALDSIRHGFRERTRQIRVAVNLQFVGLRGLGEFQLNKVHLVQQDGSTAGVSPYLELVRPLQINDRGNIICTDGERSGPTLGSTESVPNDYRVVGSCISTLHLSERRPSTGEGQALGVCMEPVGNQSCRRPVRDPLSVEVGIRTG